VAVFDWFDVLAYPGDHSSHPNRLKAEYGGDNGNSHPNSTANSDSTQVFATNPDNFIDNAWNAFMGGESGPQKIPSTSGPEYGQTVTYTVVVQDLTAPLTATVHLTDVVPSGLAYLPGTLTATAGTVTETASPTLLWSGVLTPTPVISVTYAVTVTTVLTQVITNSVVIVAAGYETVTRTATIIANGYTIYLPTIFKDATQ
jgi:uncharacterized repeat protein (TIGR01451 family)